MSVSVSTSFPVDAPTSAWAAIADPTRLASVLPGCHSVTRDPGEGGEGPPGASALHVVAEVAVASLRGLWAGTVVTIDADAVRIVGSGAPGTVDLVARVDSERTTLTVDGTVTGALATVGSAVLTSAIRRLALDLLAAAAAPPPAPPTAPGSVVRAPAATPPAAPSAPTRVARAGSPTTVVDRRSRRVLGLGVAAVSAVLLVLRRRARRIGR